MQDVRFETPPLVMADPVQQQVILNLVMNAVEAMSRSGNAMRVLRLGTETGPASTVVVSVVDSGPRVDPEVVTNDYLLVRAYGLAVHRKQK